MNNYGKATDGINKRITQIVRISKHLSTCTDSRKREKLQAKLKAMIPKEKKGRGRPRKIVPREE